MNNKRIGDIHENMVKQQSMIAENRDVLTVWKCPEPVKITNKVVATKLGWRKAKKGEKTNLVVGRLEKHVFVDFFGLGTGGLFIGMDAKHTTNPVRWSWASYPEQCETLGKVAKFGGLAFFLVRRLDKERGQKVTEYLFPVDEEGRPLSMPSDKKSIRWEDCEQYKIDTGSYFFQKMIEGFSG